MHIDTIVFDLDGTLVDTAGDLTASLNHALQMLGRAAVDPASVRRMVGRGGRVLVERGLAATGDPAPELVERGVELFLAHYRANVAVHSAPFAGVVPVLDALGRDYRLAVCTNKPVALAHSLIARLGWEARFGAVLGGDSLPWRKPDPRHLESTVAQAGGRAAIFVGDSETDAETAVAAKVPLVLVRQGYSLRPVDAIGADCIIDDFHGLEAAVAGIQRAFNRARPQTPA